MRLDGCRYEAGKLIFDTRDPACRKLAYDFKAGDYELTKSAKKRSRNANDYLWALATEIGEAVGLTKEEIYQRAIKEAGVYKDFHDIRFEDAQSLRTAWEMLGTGWLTEQVDWEQDGEHVVVRAYYGSSTYNTKQMSRLIDKLTQDAHSVGVQTLDDQRLNGLMEEWSNAERARRTAR